MAERALNGIRWAAPWSGWVIAAAILVGSWATVAARLTSVEVQLVGISKQIEQMVTQREFVGFRTQVERELDRLTRNP